MCMQETGYSSSCCDEKLLVLLVSQFKTVKFLLCENTGKIFQYYGDETLSFPPGGGCIWPRYRK